MDILFGLIAAINSVMNKLGEFLFAPVIESLPGWMSNTIISAVVGVLLMIVFKYTSNQQAIGQVKDKIKANMLAMKLFKDNMSVMFESQGRLFKCAGMMLYYSIRPMAVMVIPVILILSQMSLWYQASPLGVGQEALVTVQLEEMIPNSWPQIKLAADDAFEVSGGPVRVLSKGQVLWKIRGLKSGYHKLLFETGAGGDSIEKELAIGDEFMRVNPVRSSQQWGVLLLKPGERPLEKEWIVDSIKIEYPARESYTAGTGWWVIYFFVMSMLFALCFKPFLGVKI